MKCYYGNFFIIYINILSYLGIIFNANDHKVVVNGNCKRHVAVSESRNIFLFVKLRYYSIVFKWAILASSLTLGLIL